MISFWFYLIITVTLATFLYRLSLKIPMVLKFVSYLKAKENKFKYYRTQQLIVVASSLTVGFIYFFIAIALSSYFPLQVLDDLVN